MRLLLLGDIQLHWIIQEREYYIQENARYRSYRFIK
jgi:hypothetical protein